MPDRKADLQAQSLPDLDESELIAQAQDGHVDAFNVLVLRYQDRIYSIAYRIMGDGASAADMTQDAFISAYRKLDTYRGGSFVGWLGRIVTNACYDEIRRRKRRPATAFDDLPGGDADDGPPLPADTPTPEEVALQSDLSHAIQDCIQSLNEDQRVVMVMCDVQGQSYQEIAETLSINLGTVKSRLSRARFSVRNCLQAVQELLPPEFRLVDE
ncbi:sigma-70 family RNA polymerase sigma factor [Phototrophicus methaneseepsis]|uniref:Sigma-70 family RNA polymerase sigma factor n=1 Tax=Phototrophicus methaneseepsis TaxID=2710758 RepID=A0A7S8EA50_9CHLR|nr:sigma-70 family RNA polymerase sigma factor [Phototrophicus methaneseepsis]QPC83223.1 sigma-70 family RNA polymerase sigma factor [Phototrophicus methaneseepsis]